MKIAVIGNRASCSYCRNLAKVVGTYPSAGLSASVKKQLDAASAEFKAWMAGCSACTLVDADKNTDKETSSAVYNAYRAMSLTKPIAGMPAGKYNWPVVSVFDGDSLKGSFLARNLPADTLIAKIEALCPSCAESDPVPVPDAGVVCPTCKRPGWVKGKAVPK